MVVHAYTPRIWEPDVIEQESKANCDYIATPFLEQEQQIWKFSAHNKNVKKSFFFNQKFPSASLVRNSSFRI